MSRSFSSHSGDMPEMGEVADKMEKEDMQKRVSKI